MSPATIEDIATARLTLRALDPDDAAEMVDVLADPALYVFTGGAAPDLDELKQRYRLQVDGPTDGRETWFNWIVLRSSDDRAIGFVQSTVEGTSADTAWLIGVHYQGQGFATEATRAMCTWLAQIGVAEITAHVHPEHAASQAVARAIGLDRTGEIDSDGEEIWASSVT